MKIKNRFDGRVKFEDDTKSLKRLCEENRGNLSWSNLSGSDLSWSNLSGSNLRGSDLRGSDLSWSDLSWSDLRGSNLRGSDLRGSDLRGSNLRGSNLSWSDLRGSDLRGSIIEFPKFPSIRLISSIPLGDLSNNLTIELMRRDAFAHPDPDKFDKWVRGGDCPYNNEERFWFFSEQRKLYKPGIPQMRDSDLILAICKEKGWGIKGYLKTGNKQ